MGNTTRVQCNERKGHEQWHICVPSAVAQAMEFMAGETVEWVIVDKDELLLRRIDIDATFPTAKKKRTSLTRFF